MIIIHRMKNQFLPRLAASALQDRLAAMPAVVLTGSRQVGKSTLAQQVAGSGRHSYTLDDLDTLDLARRDPQALVGGPDLLAIDEVQREPGLLHAIKRSIDRRRVAGQFLLTGSANLLVMKGVSESLAGRASYLTLRPMTRRELLGQGRAGSWSELLAAEPASWPDILATDPAEAADWKAAVRRGGFPTPALELTTEAHRSIWFDGYVRTYLERDLQDIASIAALPDFRRLMRAACHRLGQILNQTELGRDCSMPQPTVHRYLNLLECSWMLTRLPAFARNRTKRLIKSPKLYWGDTGLAVHLAAAATLAGQHLENLVLNDLLAWRDAVTTGTDIHYWRTTTGAEVDFVIESPGGLLPVEIKASSRPRLADAAGLLAFRGEYPGECPGGLLLHTGDEIVWLAPGVLAAPWWRVL
jgi:predicted AAA+ superfamily ATPase